MICNVPVSYHFIFVYVCIRSCHACMHAMCACMQCMLACYACMRACMLCMYASSCRVRVHALHASILCMRACRGGVSGGPSPPGLLKYPRRGVWGAQPPRSMCMYTFIACMYNMHAWYACMHTMHNMHNTDRMHDTCAWTPNKVTTSTQRHHP